MTATENGSFISGASIGILAAMASSKINKPSKNGRVNYKKLESDAFLIASAFFGEDLPDGEEAIEGYVKAMQDGALKDETTFADLVAAIDRANDVKLMSIDEAVKKAEESVSPDIVSLNHIDADSDALGDVMASWAELEYEHKRQISTMRRPKYSDALAEARATGINRGVFDEDGKFSNGYMLRFTKNLREEADRIRAEFDAMDDPNWVPRDEQAAKPLRADSDKVASDEATADRNRTPSGADMSGFDILVMDGTEDDDEEMLELAMGDLDDTCSTSEDGHDVSEDIVEANADAGCSHDASGDASDVDEGISDADTGKIAIEPIAEVVETIVSDDQAADIDTAPIVMEPEAIVEEVVAEAQEIAEDATAEVEEAVVEIVEEMEAVAEMDIDECESFTDRFMAVGSNPADEENDTDDPKRDAEAALEELYGKDDISEMETVAMEPVKSSTASSSSSSTGASDALEATSEIDELRANAQRRRAEVGKFLDRDEQK